MILSLQLGALGAMPEENDFFVLPRSDPLLSNTKPQLVELKQGAA